MIRRHRWVLLHDRHGWWRFQLDWRPEWRRSGWLYRGMVRRYGVRLGPFGACVLRFRTDHDLRRSWECEP